MTGMCRRYKGEIREDGYILLCVRKSGKEEWAAPEFYHRQRVAVAHAQARKIAEKKKVPFNVTLDDLLDIYPVDGKCPVFRFPLTWGGGYEGRNTSPSLDRIHPALGYVPGNVMWISNYANQLKNGNSLDTLRTLLNFYEGLQSGTKTPI